MACICIFLLLCSSCSSAAVFIHRCSNLDFGLLLLLNSKKRGTALLGYLQSSLSISFGWRNQCVRALFAVVAVLWTKKTTKHKLTREGDRFDQSAAAAAAVMATGAIVLLIFVYSLINQPQQQQ